MSAEAIERAIELNRVAVDLNRRAFRWARRVAHDPAAVEAMSRRHRVRPSIARRSTSLDEVIERRIAYLTATRTRPMPGVTGAWSSGSARVEAKRARGRADLTEAVARYYFKLLAYKDEYEVARLYTDGVFLDQLERQFEGRPKLKFHLAPPLLAERDPHTGHLKKRAYGPWMLRALRYLARGKRLRGTPLDPFGYSDERRRSGA